MGGDDAKAAVDDDEKTFLALSVKIGEGEITMERSSNDRPPPALALVFAVTVEEEET